MITGIPVNSRMLSAAVYWCIVLTSLLLCSNVNDNHKVGVVSGCYINGANTGYCTEATLDYAFRQQFMPFCWGHTQYPVCLPQPQYIPPMREFPEGRWTNHTAINKDGWVEQEFTTFVAERIRIETNKALKRARQNEYGEKGKIKHRFSGHGDCIAAFKHLFCWANFPRCDPEKDLSLPMCESACVNFFKSCGYKPDLFRCGPMEYFNGYEPEKPASIDEEGYAVYLRDYFPGGPFVKNKFKANGHEKPVCTPAITGAAARRVGGSAMGSAGGLLWSAPLVVMVLGSAALILPIG